MPGPAMHHLIADKLKNDIFRRRGLGSTLTAAQYDQLQTLLGDPKNLPYLFLGCQGPDFLFFNTRDMNNTLGDFVNAYFEVYDFIENFKKTLLDAIPQPVLDAIAAVGEAVDEVVSSSVLLSELQQTFQDLQQVLDGFVAVLTEMLKKFVSEFDLFNLVEHPYRDGASNGKWWWFDALHYRKTGKFAKALLDSAPAGSPLHLYAIGYLTHFAADTVGHPYVNINDGGPYRSQAQRHKTGENYQDVFNMLAHLGIDWNRSKLHTRYNFNFTGSDTVDLNTNMPEDLAKMIAKAIHKVYDESGDGKAEYGNDISPKDIQNAYRIYYRWLKNATDTGILPEPVPYSFTKELEEIWDKAMDNMGSIGDFLEDAIDKAGSNFNILSIFLVLAALIAAAVLAALAVIDALLGAIATVTTATIRYTACLIYELLYNAFQTFRLGVSLNGLAFPMVEHLNDPRFAQFQNTSFADPTGINAAALLPFLPRLKWNLPQDALSAIFHQEKHLVYPVSSGERNPVMAAPNTYFDKTALFYAFGDIPLNPSLIDQIVALANNVALGDEAALQTLLSDEKNRLGNAGMLTQEVYDRWQRKVDFPDFNLDGDRGYAFAAWSHVKSGAVEDGKSPSAIAVKNTPSDTPFASVPVVNLDFIL